MSVTSTEFGVRSEMAPGMVTTALLLREIIQKLFFSAMWCHILAAKDNFHGPLGSQRGYRDPLAHFLTRMTYFCSSIWNFVRLNILARPF